MMRRAVLSFTGGAGIVAAMPSFAQTQRVMRMGVLADYPAAGDEEFRSAMSQRGWEVGRNLIIERRYSKGDNQLYTSLAKQLVDLPVDMIQTRGIGATMSAFHATRSIPIVALTDFPVEMGIAKSLARPGGNVTGMVFQSAEYSGKQIDIFRAIRPGLQRIGVVFVDSDLGRRWFAGWQTFAEKMGISLFKIPYPYRIADIEPSLAVAKRERAEAVEFSLNIALRGAGWQQITPWAIEHKVLTSGAEYARGEAAVAFGANSSSVIKQLAEQTDRVLRGANPAEIPMQQPTVFDLIINRKIVRAIGLTVPQSVLVQATEVID